MFKRINKGQVGYINYKKRFQLVYTILILLISLAIFFVGFFTSGKDTKNLLTVLAILGVLPGAKSLVNFVVFFPYHSTDRTLLEKAWALEGEGCASYADLVITSPEHVMHFDYLCVAGTELIGYTTSKHAERIEKYFTETMKKQGVSIHMKIFTSEEALLKRMKGMQMPQEQNIPAELSEWIWAILV